MEKTYDPNDTWDSREMGADEAHARLAAPEHARALDAAMGMQTISIRLPQELIGAYKLVAAHHGIGYQPLMRDVLQRFVPGALKEILEHHEAKAQQSDERMAVSERKSA